MNISDPGGFKLWECAIDLARFVCQHLSIDNFDQRAYPQWPGLPRVLELGCGQGIPGILLLKAGAEVHFQVITHAGSCKLLADRDRV